jgi:hypothetical protein
MLAIAIPQFLPAQERPGASDLSCVESLELPTRGLLAAGAGKSGTVTAAIHIGDGGQVDSVELTGDNNILKGEVRVAVNLSHFAPKCSGREFRVVFAFTLEDPPTDSIIPPAVKFVPPNRFELTFRRLKPIVDPAPRKGR